MPVPHAVAVIGQQLATGHPGTPPWQERTTDQPVVRAPRRSVAAALRARAARTAHVVARTGPRRRAARV